MFHITATIKTETGSVQIDTCRQERTGLAAWNWLLQKTVEYHGWMMDHKIIHIDDIPLLPPPPEEDKQLTPEPSGLSIAAVSDDIAMEEPCMYKVDIDDST